MGNDTEKPNTFYGSATPDEPAIAPPEQPEMELPEYLNDALQGLGEASANLASGNIGALTSQLAMAKAQIDDAMAKAPDLEIAVTGVDTTPIANIGLAEGTDPATKSRMVEDAVNAVSKGNQLVAEVTAAEMRKGLGTVAQAAGGAIGLASIFAEDVFEASQKALKSGDFSKISAQVDEMKESTLGVIAQLKDARSMNAAETSVDGTIVTNYAGLKKEPLVPDISEARLATLASPTVGIQQQIGKGLGGLFT